MENGTRNGGGEDKNPKMKRMEGNILGHLLVLMMASFILSIFAKARGTAFLWIVLLIVGAASGFTFVWLANTKAKV